MCVNIIYVCICLYCVICDNYNSYCMNVYGSQLWCFNDYKSVERFISHGEKQLGEFGELIKEHIMC